jgi:hypothetical protein
VVHAAAQQVRLGVDARLPDVFQAPIRDFTT